MDYESKQNENPTIYNCDTSSHNFNFDHLENDLKQFGFTVQSSADTFEASRESVDSLEIFELIRHINDPEHPLTLEQLNVASLDLVNVDDATNSVNVSFTPTIPHCSMATLIGLSLRVKLLRSLPDRFKVNVFITPGTHSSEHAVNKQLNDKERVAAALENNHLLDVVNKCLKGADRLEDLFASMPSF